VTSIIDRRFTSPDADRRLSQVTVVDFHPDGVLCLTGHADGSIAIWDTWSGELVDLLRGNQHVITSATWSADGSSILSSSIDKKAVL
jgi:WD40 repeat protein